MKQNTVAKRLLRARPEHLNQFEWRELLANLLDKPDRKRPWHQTREGDWKRGQE